MKLIVGLGNPGNKYSHTRHNIGFALIDQLASRRSLELHSRTKFKAVAGIFQAGVEDIILAKPTTFMNESGLAVEALVSYFKLSLADVLILSDDTNLSFGVVRSRFGGSDGGHNGLKSIIAKVGSDFSRLRIGVNNGSLGIIPLDKFVLSTFTAAEHSQLGEILAQAEKLVEQFIDNTTTPIVHQTIR